MKLLFAGLLLWATSAFAQERLIDAAAPDSARGTALVVLKHLAAGELEQAAALSNAPKRRFEVLREYRDSVGEDIFKQAFAKYLASSNQLIAEVALGPRRLLIWQLPEAGSHLAGQFYIEVDGKFLLDDVPSRERAELRKVLQRYRTEQKRGQDPFPVKGS